MECMNVLAINTSSYRLGIAIMDDQQVVGVHETFAKVNQSTRVMPAIEQLMKDVHMKPTAIDKIIVTRGPGSFTGIRIGVTIAKTMAWALDVPVIGVSTLEALAYQAIVYRDKVIVPFIDARRGRVYSGAYAWINDVLEPVIDEKNIDMNDWLEELHALKKEVVFLSPDLSLYRNMIESTMNERAIFPPQLLHRIDPVHVALAGKSYKAQDVHTFVPEYLRLAEAEKKWRESQETSNNE